MIESNVLFVQNAGILVQIFRRLVLSVESFTELEDIIEHSLVFPSLAENYIFEEIFEHPQTLFVFGLFMVDRNEFSHDKAIAPIYSKRIKNNFFSFFEFVLALINLG